MGGYGSVEHNPEINLYLNVLIVNSEEFLRCIPGGAGWKSMVLSISVVWKDGDTSFSG